MQNYTQQELKERYEKLPEVLKDAMFSTDIAAKIFAIGKKYGLTIEKTGFMAEEVGYLILGLTRPTELVSTLAEALEVKEDQAKEIASDLNHQIFYPLREALKETHQIEIGESTLRKNIVTLKKPEPPISSLPGQKISTSPFLTPRPPSAPLSSIITTPASKTQTPLTPPPVPPAIPPKPGSENSAVAQDDQKKVAEFLLPGKLPFTPEPRPQPSAAAPAPPKPAEIPPLPKPSELPPSAKSMLPPLIISTPPPISLKPLTEKPLISPTPSQPLPKPGSENSAIPLKAGQEKAAEFLLPGKPVTEKPPAPPETSSPPKPTTIQKPPPLPPPEPIDLRPQQKIKLPDLPPPKPESMGGSIFGAPKIVNLMPKPGSENSAVAQGDQKKAAEFLLPGKPPTPPQPPKSPQPQPQREQDPYRETVE